MSVSNGTTAQPERLHNEPSPLEKVATLVDGITATYEATHADDLARSEKLRLENLANSADGLLAAVLDAGCGPMVQEHAGAFLVGGLELIPDEAPEVRRLGYVLAYLALLRAPEAVTETIRKLSHDLMESVAFGDVLRDAREMATALPAVAALLHEQEALEPATPPLAISRQIDQTDFELDPDGSLAIIRSQSYGGEGGLVRLTLREAYACWAFFRLPGVEQLLVRADTERQTKLQLEYEEDKREDEARIASGTYRE